nr:MAG TPA: hypothetical protein [Caudoviricetes sp.]
MLLRAFKRAGIYPSHIAIQNGAQALLGACFFVPERSSA